MLVYQKEYDLNFAPGLASELNNRYYSRGMRKGASMGQKEVFISYKSEEFEEADWVRTELEREGISMGKNDSGLLSCILWCGIFYYGIQQ